jgi:transcription factor TFIIIB component B''
LASCSSKADSAANRAAAAAAAASPAEDISRSIKDIIRQRSREERAADARARVAKRKSDGTNDAGAKRVAAAAPGSGSGSGASASMVEALPAGAGSGSDFQGRHASSGPVSMTPQVTVVNGQIIINEQSLTVDAAVERATTLSDFTRVEENGTKLNSSTYANYTKAEKWTREDTEFFFQALQQFGSDFSLIQRLFPGRSRRQIKK